MGHPTPIGNRYGRARGNFARCLLALLAFFHLGCSARSPLPNDVALGAALARAVKVVPNVAYGPGDRQRLDLYLLKTPLPPPVLVYFHGGGWAGHAKEEMNVEVLPYLAMGFAVANIEYRILSDAPAPAAVADACCALRWVVRNGADYYLDSTRIVLAGGSAGGHLALMAGMAPSGVFDQNCTDSGDPPSQVKAVLNWGGPGDLTALVDGPEARDFARQWLEAEKRSPAELRERAQRLSPRSYVRRDGPPVLTIHGDADSLISYGQAVSLHAELERAGVRNRLYTIAGGGHGEFDPEAIGGAFAAIREFLIECGLAPESPLSLESGRTSMD